MSSRKIGQRFRAEEPEQTSLSEAVEPPRVELRRFLAGVPFSHTRKLAPEERREIQRLLLPYGICGITFALLTVPFLVLPIARQQAGIGSFFAPIILLLLCVPAYCTYWAWPYLKALRSNRLDVYIGPLRSLQGFDVAQDFYLSRLQVARHLERYVELHAVGDGRRIWRLEGVGNGEHLAGVRPIEAALVPDQDERGRRGLTPEEKAEIARRSRELRRKGPMVLSLLGSTVLAFAVGRYLTLAFPNLGPLPFILLFALFCHLRVMPYFKLFGLARHLERDLRAGIVENGYLSSGLPWVVNGMPARWRLAWLRGASGKTLNFVEARRMDADPSEGTP